MNHAVIQKQIEDLQEEITHLQFKIKLRKKILNKLKGATQLDSPALTESK